MDEEVHGFANSMVEPLAWPRKQEPYAPNGSGPKAHGPAPAPPALAYAQRMKKDIANKEIRPDVYSTVHSMVNPTALWRTNKAPKSNYEPWWGDDAPPRTELEKPPCPTEEEDSEPDLAKMKAAKFMADEKAKDEKRAAKEDEKQEAAIKKAEEEEAKEKADKAPKDEKKDDKEEEKKEGDAKEKKEGEEKKEEGKEEKKEEKKEEPATDKKAMTTSQSAPAPNKEVKAAAKTATAPAPKKEAEAAPAAKPGKIVKLMTGDLIYDKTNNLWRHEPVFLQQDEE